jgi:hypothetical protein
MTCLPQELILAVFDMCNNVNDVINLAESNDYVFDIYKANINKVVKQLIINNYKNRLFCYVIAGAYYNEHYNEHYNNIDTKLDIVKKIGNYLSNTNYTQLLQDYQILKNKSYSLNYNSFPPKILLLNYNYLQVVKEYNSEVASYAAYLTLEKYNIFIHYVNLGNNVDDCNCMIRSLDEPQIELMQKYIDRGLKLADAAKIAKNTDEDDVEKVFELHKEHKINISNAVDMINNFNETQIEKTKELIHEDIDSEIAYDLVEKFSDSAIELIIKLSRIITKDYTLEVLFGELSTFWNASETELNIMLTLLENNFNEDNIGDIANSLYNFHNYDESYLNKCIELKKKGIIEKHIYDLLESGICIDFDDEYYDSLIKNNHSSEEAIDIIIARDEY